MCRVKIMLRKQSKYEKRVPFLKFLKFLHMILEFCLKIVMLPSVPILQILAKVPKIEGMPLHKFIKKLQQSLG